MTMVIVPFQWQNPNISPATLGLSARAGLHFWHLQKEFVIFFPLEYKFLEKLIFPFLSQMQGISNLYAINKWKEMD